MLETSIEMENFYENNNLNNINSFTDIFHEPSDFSNISKISKSKFAQHYHFLCKFCNRVPIIDFMKDNKISYICECKDSPRDLNIIQVYDFLYYFNQINFGIENLKCYLHFKEYGYFCEKCEKNVCPQCFNDCSEHKDRIKSLYLMNNSIDKYNYIYNKIKDKNQNYINIENNSLVFNNELKNDNISFQSDENISLILQNKDSINLIQNKNEILMNKDEKIEIINTLESNNNDEMYDDEYYYINLITIILNDYLNFPNINHIETISNIEIHLIISHHDYNEINLNYEFADDKFKLNEIKLFGENFVENNKENCFLIINETIMELSSYINLFDIFDSIDLNQPFQLDVKLIERKYKLITDLSYMFDGISSLTNQSNFNNFKGNNIRKMNNMFNDCKLLKKLPDISDLNTENVSNMSYMFSNCTSLTDLPDISKWNTKNVNDISYMFQNCELLTSLPDISKWSTYNIEKMEGTFSNCKSLKSLPNLSNWNISDNNKNDNIFEGCELLEENFQRNNSICNILYQVLIKISFCCKNFANIFFLFFFMLSYLFDL